MATDNDLDAIVKRMVAKARRAVMDQAYEMNDVAHDMSSGTYSLARLAAMGHPYSSRRGGTGVPYGDPAVINYVPGSQTGRFRGSWYVEYRADPEGIPQAILRNSDPKAEMLEGGTERMIARPIRARVIQMTRPGYIERMAKAMQEAING